MQVRKANVDSVKRILVVDTATPVCSVAAADSNGRHCELLLARKQTHARHVMTMTEQVLTQLDCGLEELTHLAVSCGPGSFTGLRIGISTVKGVALAHNLPVFTLPTLELLAYQAYGWQGAIVPMIDARRQEVYLGAYRWEKGGLVEVVPPTVGSPERVADDIQGPLLLLGNGALAYREQLRHRINEKLHFAAQAWNAPHALTAALALVSGGWSIEPVSAAEVMPIYLRKSDAEVNLLRQQKKNQ